MENRQERFDGPVEVVKAGRGSVERNLVILKELPSVMGKPHIDIPKEKIEAFCLRNRIRRLALFGSVLRDDFGPSSDVDVLVEFEAGARVGLLRLAGLEIELGEMLGRRVDLSTPGFLSDYFRAEVLAEAEVQYDAA